MKVEAVTWPPLSPAGETQAHESCELPININWIKIKINKYKTSIWNSLWSVNEKILASKKVSSKRKFCIPESNVKEDLQEMGVWRSSEKEIKHHLSNLESKIWTSWHLRKSGNLSKPVSSDRRWGWSLYLTELFWWSNKPCLRRCFVSYL